MFFKLYKNWYQIILVLFFLFLTTFFGKGIGEGTLKNRVPEAHTDYIISVISEEFGVIAIMLILVLFLVFIFSILKKVSKESDNRAKLILMLWTCAFCIFFTRRFGYELLGRLNHLNCVNLKLPKLLTHVNPVAS